MPIITLLTDFGTADAYVAQMKGQILSICPNATLIDVSHAVPPQDVVHGSLLLAQAVPYFPDGTVHIAVVDPGVGTARDILAIEVECNLPGTPGTTGSERSTRQRLVLPDNGLASLLAQQSRILAMHRVTEPRFWNSSISSTFHGRDIMGPVAAHWAAGQSMAAFGPQCTGPQCTSMQYTGMQFVSMKTMPWSEPERIGSKQIRGHVIALDHFGNIITNLPADWLDTSSQHQTCRVRVSTHSLELPIGRTYGEFAEGQAIVLVGSHGFLEVAVVNANAAKALEVVRGDAIEIELVA